MDRFRTHKPLLDSPGSVAFEITPSDSTDFYANTSMNVPRSLFIGTGGNLTVETAGYWNIEANVVSGNNIVTFNNVPNGTTIPIRVKRVLASTTANNIVGIY